MGEAAIANPYFAPEAGMAAMQQNALSAASVPPLGLPPEPGLPAAPPAPSIIERAAAVLADTEATVTSTSAAVAKAADTVDTAAGAVDKTSSALMHADAAAGALIGAAKTVGTDLSGVAARPIGLLTACAEGIERKLGAIAGHLDFLHLVATDLGGAPQQPGSLPPPAPANPQEPGRFTHAEHLDALVRLASRIEVSLAHVRDRLANLV